MNYAILKEDWLLREWKESGPVLYNWKTGDIRPLGPEEFYVLRCCDGNHDFDSMAFLRRHKKKLEEYCLEGVAAYCGQGTSLSERQKYRQAPNHILLGILLSVTGRCNFNCRHCYMEAPKGLLGEFTKEELNELLRGMMDANVQEIALTGGEPLLCPHLYWFIRRLRQEYICLSEIFTNGALISEEFLLFLKELGCYPVFKVSFDGAGAHDYMRGKKGAEEETLRGVRLLLEHGFKVVIVSCIDKVAARQLPQTFDLLRDMGIDQWWISEPVETGNWKGNNSGLTLEEMTNCMEYILRRWAKEGRPFHLRLWLYGRYYKKEEGPFFVRQPVSKSDQDYLCASSQFFACIQPDGVMIPCAGYIGSYVTKDMPNVKEVSISEAWEDTRLRKICDIRKAEIAKENKECRTCKYLYDCAGGCRSAAITRTGNVWIKDPLTCQVFREGYRERFYKLADELMEEWEAVHHG